MHASDIGWAMNGLLVAGHTASFPPHLFVVVPPLVVLLPGDLLLLGRRRPAGADVTAKVVGSGVCTYLRT